MMRALALGPVIIDVKGLSLEAAEREMLAHPLVGGVIVFARNYSSPEQLKALTAEIRSMREPQLLISVDQEGGRVQRLKEGFTRLPAMAELGRLCARDRAGALKAAGAIGRILAHELSAHGLDFSFAPVLDIEFGRSAVIGERAFSADPDLVASLAGEFVAGLALGGVAAVGKHFPGHGFAEADSHLAVPQDPRSLADIEAADLLPYRKLIPLGLAGVMPAHVIYPSVDPRPAAFSEFWLKRVLRGRLAFDGVIFSDDLSMEGASVAGDIVDRAKAALGAGCDMVLVCNAPESAARLLERLDAGPVNERRADRMRARAPSEPASSLAQARNSFCALMGQGA